MRFFGSKEDTIFIEEWPAEILFRILADYTILPLYSMRPLILPHGVVSCN